MVAGCTMSSESWVLLENEWKTVLNDFKISAFRSSDCNASKGEFISWDGRKKDALRNKLIEILNDCWRGKNAPICPVFASCVLDESIFERISEDYPDINLSPYELCILGIVGGSKMAISNIKGENTLKIFFEEGQEVRPHIRKELKKQKKSERRIEDISFVSKKEHMPLQVADMIAFEVWKSRFEGTRKILLDLIRSGVGQSIDIDEMTIRSSFNKHSHFS